jgi:Short C-terminal domain
VATRPSQVGEGDGLDSADVVAGLAQISRARAGVGSSANGSTSWRSLVRAQQRPSHKQARSGRFGVPGLRQQREEAAAPPQAAPQATEPAAAGGLTPEVMEQLKQLGELHEQNVLSDEEFEREKAKLLGSA